MKKYLIITADTNDGDYVTQKTLITDDKLELLKPMIEAVKNCKENYNYETGEMISETEGADEIYKNVPNFDLFDSCVPHGEYGIHTIESIELLEVINEQKLL